MKNLNYSVIFLSAILVIAACSPGKDDQQKLDELKQQRSKLEKEISDLEKKISLTDTSGPLQLAVRTLEIKPTKINKILEIQGLVESDRNVQMSADFGGRVLEVMVKEGQKVSKGTLLVRLDNELVLKSLNEVRNRLDLAKITFEKQQRLKDKNVGTEMEYLRAKNDFEAMKNQEQTLLAQASKYNVKAQFDGVVDQVFVNEGETAGPGSPILRLVDNRVIKIKADVSESYLSSFKTGQKVTVSFPAIKKEIVATISSVGQVIDAANRTFPLFIYMDNKDNLLKPNLLAVVNASEYKNDSAIVVPSKIVKRTGNIAFVYKAEMKDGQWKSAKTEVITGMSTGGNTEIVSGLSIGDQVITEGYQGLESDDFIKILK